MPSYSPLTIRSYPKVNLALDILGKDPSGYHEIQTVFHQLAAPFDELSLELCENGEITVESDNPKVPMDVTNTVWRAALLLQENTATKKGAKIYIKKRIPLMSGLGGGSSNAVAALKGLAQLWGITCCGGGHEKSECLLQKIARQIGMDCAFFFHGGTALGEHFGEKITPLPPLPPAIKFEIIDTGVQVSSKKAYESIDLVRCGKNREKTKRLIAAIHAGDAQAIMQNLHNDFEETNSFRHLSPAIPAIAPISTILAGSGGAAVKISIQAPCRFF